MKLKVFKLFAVFYLSFFQLNAQEPQIEDDINMLLNNDKNSDKSTTSNSKSNEQKNDESNEKNKLENESMNNAKPSDQPAQSSKPTEPSADSFKPTEPSAESSKNSDQPAEISKSENQNNVSNTTDNQPVNESKSTAETTTSVVESSTANPTQDNTLLNKEETNSTCVNPIQTKKNDMEDNLVEAKEILQDLKFIIDENNDDSISKNNKSRALRKRLKLLIDKIISNEKINPLKNFLKDDLKNLDENFDRFQNSLDAKDFENLQKNFQQIKLILAEDISTLTASLKD